MKFTLSWLKEHLDTDEPLDRLADKLTMIGLEVESIEDKAKALAPFTIARVVTAEQHPNADRLRVCTVDTGDGEFVSGLPVYAGVERAEGPFEDRRRSCEVRRQLAAHGRSDVRGAAGQ